jgi:hypothetical protein
MVNARRITNMTLITVKFTPRELDMLTILAADQLFRREFIDSRLPGSAANPAELSQGKKLVERLRVTADRAKGMPLSRRGRTTA